MKIPFTYKMTLAALAGLILAINAHAGDPCPKASPDLNYYARQAQLRSEAIERENTRRRLDQFLSDQGY
jgi:hypothetical protein